MLLIPKQEPRALSNFWVPVEMPQFFRQFSRRERLFHQGEPSESLHIITSGYVKLVRLTASGDERILDILGQGDVLGIASLGQMNYQLDAIALSDVTTQVFADASLSELVRDQPESLDKLMQSLSQQLFDAWQRVSDTTETVQIRLIKLLLHYAVKFGHIEGDWLKLKLRVTHEDIASMISSSRISVTNEMSDLRKMGLLEGGRGLYRLHEAALRDYIS